MKAPRTLLLLPLIPALAFGIVEVAGRIHTPTAVAKGQAPDVTPEPDRCLDCSYPA